LIFILFAYYLYLFIFFFTTSNTRRSSSIPVARRHITLFRYIPRHTLLMLLLYALISPYDCFVTPMLFCRFFSCRHDFRWLMLLMLMPHYFRHRRHADDAVSFLSFHFAFTFHDLSIIISIIFFLLSIFSFIYLFSDAIISAIYAFFISSSDASSSMGHYFVNNTLIRCHFSLWYFRFLSLFFFFDFRFDFLCRHFLQLFDAIFLIFFSLRYLIFIFFISFWWYWYAWYAVFFFDFAAAIAAMMPDISLLIDFTRYAIFSFRCSLRHDTRFHFFLSISFFFLFDVDAVIFIRWFSLSITLFFLSPMLWCCSFLPPCLNIRHYLPLWYCFADVDNLFLSFHSWFSMVISFLFICFIYWLLFYLSQPFRHSRLLIDCHHLFYFRRFLLIFLLLAFIRWLLLFRHADSWFALSSISLFFFFFFFFFPSFAFTPCRFFFRTLTRAYLLPLPPSSDWPLIASSSFFFSLIWSTIFTLLPAAFYALIIAICCRWCWYFCRYYFHCCWFCYYFHWCWYYFLIFIFFSPHLFIDWAAPLLFIDDAIHDTPFLW